MVDRPMIRGAAALLALLLAASLAACSGRSPDRPRVTSQRGAESDFTVSEATMPPQVELPATDPAPAPEPSAPPTAAPEPQPEPDPEPSAPATPPIHIIEDFREVFIHGEKPAQYQKYIMLHDTEGESSPQSVVDWWAGNGNLIAAHFVIGKDGTVVQCVPLDAIAHHAGWGSDGHNDKFGVTDESRDDLKGRKPTTRYTDYGMNSYSIGIELVHVGGSGDYPRAQLEALDAVIAYIDDHYGFESEIIDHKMWRKGNSDTSPEFAGYLSNYRSHRSFE